MNLAQPDEARLLADSARAMLESLVGESDPRSRWRAFREMGLTGLSVPEDQGGLGGSLAMLGALATEMGRARAPDPFLPLVHASAALQRIGGDLAGGLLASIARGELTAALSGPHGPSFSMQDGSTLISGPCPLVPAADGDMVVLVRLTAPGSGTKLAVLDPTMAGVQIRSVKTIDGRDAFDISLNEVRPHLLAPASVDEALDWADDRDIALRCCDALGAIAYLIEATAGYVSERRQFGKTLSSFQAVQHMIADMLVAQEEARSITLFALATADERPDVRRRAARAAKIKTGAAGMVVARHAIQLHGGMGVSEELDIGRFAKRLIAFDATAGTRDHHLDLQAAACRDDPMVGGYLAAACTSREEVNLGLDDGLAGFRDEVRTFLAESLPQSLAEAQRMTTTVYPEPEIARPWQRILARRGWSAPHWPAEHCGTGWSAEQRYVWAQESAAAHAPIVSPLGLPLVGPVLMRFGTAAQQQRYLPGIVSGEELWCQGFSEPSAGSDLAALTMRSVREDDHYLVNGSKMWTTQGHVADYMAALVRSGPNPTGREGISFMLIDMRSEGIEVQPIMMIGGDHEVNQVFFDNVRVPAENIVGAEGQGWEIARFLLDHERGGDLASGLLRALLRDVRSAALARSNDGAAFWRDFTLVAIDIDALEMTELRKLLLPSEMGAAAPSILKRRASEIQQAVTELGLRVLGADAVRETSERPLPDDGPLAYMAAFTPRYLNSRASTIFGGALQIQNSLIARTIV